MRAALLPTADWAGRYSVSFGEGDDMEVQFAELRSDVRHIQSDTVDIKAAVRETGSGLTALREKLEQNGIELNRRVDAATTAANARFDDLAGRIDGVRRELSDKSDSVRAEVIAKIEAMATRMDNERKELTARTESVREELTTRFERMATNVESGRKDLLEKLSDEISTRTGEVNERVEGLGKRLDGRIDDLSRRLDGTHKDVTDKIDGVKADLWKARLWAIGLQVALAASLLGVMARGFHWL